MVVHKVLDIEENVWSPMFGLKGKIDATVQVMHRNTQGKMLTSLAPFELKTGKSILNMSHRAQTALYTLLLSDRYGTSQMTSLTYDIRL
jgi:DNA replication ATP-dependent helicase Dna2